MSRGTQARPLGIADLAELDREVREEQLLGGFVEAEALQRIRVAGGQDLGQGEPVVELLQVSRGQPAHRSARPRVTREGWSHVTSVRQASCARTNSHIRSNWSHPSSPRRYDAPCTASWSHARQAVWRMLRSASGNAVTQLRSSSLTDRQPDRVMARRSSSTSKFIARTAPASPPAPRP